MLERPITAVNAENRRFVDAIDQTQVRPCDYRSENVSRRSSRPRRAAHRQAVALRTANRRPGLVRNKLRAAIPASPKLATGDLAAALALHREGLPKRDSHLPCLAAGLASRHNRIAFRVLGRQFRTEFHVHPDCGRHQRYAQRSDKQSPSPLSPDVRPNSHFAGGIKS